MKITIRANPEIVIDLDSINEKEIIATTGIIPDENPQRGQIFY